MDVHNEFEHLDNDEQQSLQSTNLVPSQQWITPKQKVQESTFKFNSAVSLKENVANLQDKMMFMENVRHNNWALFLKSFEHKDPAFFDRISFNGIFNTSIVLFTVDEMFQKLIYEIMTLSSRTKAKKPKKIKVKLIKKKTKNKKINQNKKK